MTALQFVPHTKRRKMMRNPLGIEHLRALLSYDATTGALTRLVTTSSNAVAGDTAGSVDAKGYLVVSIDGVAWKAHQLAWFLHYGKWPVGWLDHRNRDRRDNRIENLREADPTASSINRATWGKSAYRGVYQDSRSGRWCAHIRYRGKRTRLGSYATEVDAAMAYDVAAHRVHGGLAVLNFGGAGASS